MVSERQGYVVHFILIEIADGFADRIVLDTGIICVVFLRLVLLF